MGILIICIALVLIGAYLFGGFEKLLGNAPRLLGLKPFEDKAAGTADLLNWAALVAEGVVQTKDGALLAGFFYQGKDLAASTADERNYITQRLNAALARLGNGWVSWHDAVRLPAAGYSDPELSHFPDHVTAAIDEERRQHFLSAGQLYESQYVMTLMYTPPARRNTKVMDFVYDDETRSDGHASRILEQFLKALDDLQDAVGDVLPLRRMGSFETPAPAGGHFLRDELVNFLNFTLTGETNPINIPSPAMYLDAYLGLKDLWPGDRPKIGDQFVCCVSIAGFPSDSYPNILAVMDTLPIAYRWSTRFIYLDQQNALAALGSYRRKWRQKITGLASQVFRTKNAQINEDALAMAQEIDTAITDAHSNLITYGYYTANVVLMDTSREQLEENARFVTREITRLGFSARIETVNAVEAWLGTLPGHPRPNIRRPLIHTLNLADLLPLSSVWPGQAQNPCPLYPQPSPPLMYAATTGATPLRLNLHQGDVGHTTIFGPTGAGKSVLLATIAAQFRRYRHATITAFDKGRSMFALASAIPEARHYDLAGEQGSPGLCPLRYLDTAADTGWAEEWIAICFELMANRPPTPRQREAIHQALSLMRASSEGRSLTHFVTTVQDVEIRDALQHYTIAGPLGALLDSEQDGLTDSPFVVFEIEELMGMGEKNLIPVLLYLFRRFERSLKGQPALLILDEAWVMLGHPVFRGKIREWLKVLRKANCAVVLATQSLSDAAASGILDVLMEACPTKILLPNEEADKSGTSSVLGPRDLYALFGLNETEIEIIKNARKKRQYYYISPLGRRLFELRLGAYALAFVAASDKVSVARIRELTDRYGADWVHHWLEEKGVPHEALTESKAA